MTKTNASFYWLRHMQSKALTIVSKNISLLVLNFFVLLITNIFKKLSSYIVSAYEVCTAKIETPEDGIEAVAITVLIVFLSFPFLKQSGDWLTIMLHSCIAIATFYIIWGWKQAFRNFVQKFFFNPSYRTLIIQGLIALALVPVAHGLSKSYIETYINISTSLSPQYFPNSILIFNFVGILFSYLTILIISILALQVRYSAQIFACYLAALGKGLLISFKKPDSYEKQIDKTEKPIILVGLSSFLKMAVCFYIGYFLNMIEIEKLPNSFYFPGKLVAHKFDHFSISSCSSIQLNNGQRIKNISSSEAIISREKKSTITFRKVDCKGNLLAKS